MAEDFNYFKRHVSIIQVAETLGYEFNPKAGRNGRIEFAHKHYPNIVITNPKAPEKQVYFTRDDDNNKGSVIDFVKHRLHMFNVDYEKEFDGVNKVLHEFAQVPYSLDSRLANQKIYQKENSKSFNKEEFNLFTPSVKDLNYLMLGRGIAEETIMRFLPFINIVQKKEANPDKYSFKNIGFPFRIPGKNELAGFEIVNYNFKQLPEGTKKTHAVWAAELFEKGTRATNIFFAESAIDAISFYQLYKHKYNFDSVLISTGGTVCADQVKNVLAHYPNAKINTIFDNDLTGKLYDIRVAAIQMARNLSISKKPDEVDFALEGKDPFTLPCAKVSLRAFCTASGLRPDVRAHKSEGKDFNADLQRAKAQQNDLKTSSYLKR